MNKNLIVDLDGTFLLNDLFVEVLIKNILTKPFYSLSYLFKSRIELKNLIFKSIDLKKISIIENDIVINFIKERRHFYNKIILFSASPNIYVSFISNKYKIFDDYVGSTTVNLKGSQKVNVLRNMGIHNFDYIGNSKIDLEIKPYSASFFMYNSKKKQILNYNN